MKKRYNPDTILRDCKGNPIKKLGPKRDLNAEYREMIFAKGENYRYDRKLRALTESEKEALRLQREREAMRREVETSQSLASQSMLERASFAKESAILSDRNETR